MNNTTRRVSQEHSWETTAAQVARGNKPSIFSAALAQEWDRAPIMRRYGQEIVDAIDACRESARKGNVKLLIRNANKLSAAMDRRGLCQ